MTRPGAVLRAIIGCGILLTLFLVAMALKPLAIEPFNRSKCRSQLSAIGQCILLYANDHGGKLPADLGAMAREEDAPGQVFICPDSDTLEPSNLNFDSVAPWVNAHSDYIYVGAGMKMPSPPGDNYSTWQNVVWAY